jgi:hypothetical protein
MVTIDEIKAGVAQLEREGVIERTGKMRWSERCQEWQPVYVLSELGKKLEASGISPDEYRRNKAKAH